MGNIVGIDLGTTFSAIAMVNDIGKPEIIPNNESERITASALFFDNDENNTVYVGKEALNSSRSNDEGFARWVKRYMGEKEYPEVIRGKKRTPSELSSYIIKKLIQDAAGQKGEITGGVITVPAYFDEVRRKATMDAGEMAGLNVLGIVNEPTAAAIYYASEFQLDGKTMVFDLGGGTFDVTILTVNNNKVDIICSRGDHRLGGYDFDQAITKMVDAQYEKKYGKKLTAVPKYKNGCEIDAEDLKCSLSKRKELNRPFMGNEGAIDFKLTREEFETAVSPFMARIEMLVEDVLDEAKLAPSDIKQVIFAGGSTRMPAVEKLLTDIFSYPPTKIGNVDECVALGAAIYAGLITLSDNPAELSTAAASTLSKMTLQEVCNHSYGVKSLELDKETNTPKEMNTIIIEKNSKIPKSVTKTFYTVVENQKVVDIYITQGESMDIDLVNKINKEEDKMVLSGTQPINSPMEITYTYDKNQRMHCTFHEINSGIKKEICLDMSKEKASSNEIEDMFNIE